MPLFNNRLAPLTFSIGFVEAPLEAVVDAYVARLNKRLSPGVLERVLTTILRPVVYKDVAEPLEQALQRLVPLQKLGANRYLFLKTDSAWTAFFHNGCQGGATFETATMLADVLDCRAVSTSCRPDTLSGQPPGSRNGMWGSVQFVLFQGKGGLRNRVRSVAAVQDDRKWCFEAHGQVQPFENVDNYNAKNKRDRFTSELLQAYCLALGIRILDPSFYLSSGRLVVKRCEYDRGMSLLKAQKTLGLTDDSRCARSRSIQNATGEIPLDNRLASIWEPSRFAALRVDRVRDVLDVVGRDGHLA